MSPEPKTEAAPAAAPPARPGHAPFHILINPAAGARDHAAARQAVARALRSGGAEYEFVAMRKPRALEEQAAELAQRALRSGGSVVAAGGDGTLNGVVRGVLGSGCRFGVLPMGTFNYFSRNHGIPSELEAACQVLLQGRVRPVQVGTVNDRIFLVNASVGLYPRLLEEREQAKRQFGRSRLVALASAALFLLREHRRMRLLLHCEGVIDDVETSTVFVGNNRLQLEQIGLVEAASVDRGLLAALYLRPVSSAALLGLALRGSLGRLGDDHNVTSFAFRELTLSLPPRRGRRLPRIKVATDGETSRLQMPLRFGIAHSRLPLLCPAAPP